MRLIGLATSPNTVEFLEQLLEQARAAEVVGVALVAYMKRRQFSFGLAGESARDPVLTLGRISVLSGALAQRVLGADRSG